MNISINVALNTNKELSNNYKIWGAGQMYYVTHFKPQNKRAYALVYNLHALLGEMQIFS